MADYGLISKNDNGDVQIDSMYQNFIMQDSGSVYPNPTQGMTSIPITSSAAPPLVAIKPSSDYFVSILGYGLSDNLYNSVKIAAGDHPPEDFSSFSTSISYLVGRTVSSAPSESYGMIVYNPDGKICFHSAYKYLKILSVHSFTLSTPNPATGTFPYVDINHPNIYNPYYILTPNWSGLATAGYEVPPPTPIFHIQAVSVGFKKLDSEYVRIRSFVFGSFANAGHPLSTSYWSGSFTLLTCNI